MKPLHTQTKEPPQSKGPKHQTSAQNHPTPSTRFSPVKRRHYLKRPSDHKNDPLPFKIEKKDLSKVSTKVLQLNESYASLDNALDQVEVNTGEIISNCKRLKTEEDLEEEWSVFNNKEAKHPFAASFHSGAEGSVKESSMCSSEPILEDEMIHEPKFLLQNPENEMATENCKKLNSTNQSSPRVPFLNNLDGFGDEKDQGDFQLLCVAEESESRWANGVREVYPCRSIKNKFKS